jgi:DNA-binding transcriptional LysR family regulator
LLNLGLKQTGGTMISASTRRLSVFKAVVDLGGFNAAADRLGIAQPSVGAHIKALERQAGQPLFYRGRGIRSHLTKAGETFYSYAAEMLHKSEQASAALTDLRTCGLSEIALAAQRAISHYFLPAYLASFANRHPGMKIVTRTGTTENVLDLVRARSVDLGLFPALGPVPGLESRVLANEPLVMVVAPSHPLARRKSIDPKELGTYAFVCGLRESHYFRMIDLVLKRIGIPEYEVAMELQDFAAVKEMARHGAGIACEMLRCLKDEIQAGSLVPLSLRGQQPKMQVRCAYQTPVSDMAREFIDLFLDA